MTDDAVAVTVVDNPEMHRYEAFVAGHLAGFATYRAGPDAVVLVHTEVFPDYGRKGVGSRLAAGALDDLRARGLRVTPRCPFIAFYIRRHPHYADMVVDDRSRRGR